MKKVRELLNEQLHREIYGVVSEQSVLSAAQFMKLKNIGAVSVMRDNVLVGVLSERDMLNKVLGPGLDPRDVSVAEIMSSHPTVASPDESLETCLDKMRSTHCRHLPVLDDGDLIGMISLRDILGLDEAELLDTYLWDRTVRTQTVN